MVGSLVKAGKASHRGSESCAAIPDTVRAIYFLPTMFIAA